MRVRLEQSKEIDDRVLSKQDRAYLDVAISLARTSSCTQKHGALIVKGGSIISVGVNSRRNDPTHDFVHATWHAEEIAIRRIKSGFVKDGTIYVARVSKLDMPALSRPCNRCYVKIKAAGIKEVIYTNWSDNGTH